MSKSGYISDMQGQEHLLTDQTWSMQTERNQRMPSALCLKSQKHTVSISEMGKNTKGTDFEGISEVDLRIVKFDMLINLPGSVSSKQEYKVQGRDRG